MFAQKFVLKIQNSVWDENIVGEEYLRVLR